MPAMVQADSEVTGDMQQVQFLRLAETLKRRAISRSGHYADIAVGLCTKPVKIGKRAAAHPDYEIEAINAAHIRGASEEEIRDLVRRLHAARVDAGLGQRPPTNAGGAAE